VPDLTEFDGATAVRPLGDGGYEAVIDERWNVLRGPHGGYVATIMLRALTGTLGDSDRQPRSLTVYYPAAPKPGPLTIRCQVERSGRSMTTLSARMEQDGAPVVLALAAFSAPWPKTVEFDHSERPDVPLPGDLETIDRGELLPSFAKFFHFRQAVGDRLFSGSERALSGGWMSLREPHELDGPLVATLADAWPPAVFPIAREPVAAPTIELTVHFRAPLPAAGEWVLGVFESRVGRGGFFEEDGTLWTEDGELIAQSRQLALAIGRPPD
jgi:acyl-CoA thioesterase